VIDFRSPSALAAAAALTNPKTYSVLIGFSRWFRPSLFDAKDLLTDAILTVSDPEEGRPWDPSRGSFLQHLRIVIRDLGRRQRRSAYERLVVPTENIEEIAFDPRPDPERAAARAEELERLVRLAEELRRRLARRSERTLAVFDLVCSGVERAGDIAGQLALPVEDVYEANRQIAYYAAQINAEDLAEQEVKMELRRLKMKDDRDSTSTLERP
jgi:hypothetical protein